MALNKVKRRYMSSIHFLPDRKNQESLHLLSWITSESRSLRTNHIMRNLSLKSAVSLSIFFSGFLCAQTPRMEITVERQAKDSVQVTSPQHVFHSGDLIRFRFKPSFDGYLYVMDQSTSGKYIILYPAKDAQATNHIE